MSQSLLYYEIKLNKIVNLEDILIIPDDLDNGYCIECNLKFYDNIKEKTKDVPFCSANKISRQDKFSDYMIEMKPKSYKQ